MRLAIILIALTAACPASSQTIGNYLARFELGLGHSTLTTSRPIEDGRDSVDAVLSNEYAGWMVSVGWNWPIVKIAQDVGVGVSASARFVFSTPDNDVSYGTGNPIYDHLHPPSDGDFEAHINIPMYAMLKYGTDAHWGWRMPFGAALGLGYEFVYHDADVEYWAPFAIGELSFTAKPLRGIVKLQYQQPFGRTTFPTPFVPEGRTGESWSVALLYAFRFGPQMKTDEEKDL